MKELYMEIREVIESYFTRKLKSSGYYGEQELWYKVDDCIDELEEICDKYDKDIDDWIYDKEETWEEEREALRRRGIRL